MPAELFKRPWRGFTYPLEDLLQLVRTRDDDPDTQDVEIEKQPERRKVAVEERVLVVPFRFNGHTVFVVIDLMGRGKGLIPVGRDAYLKIFLHPFAPGE